MNINLIWSSNEIWKSRGPARSTRVEHPLHLGHVIEGSSHVIFATVLANAVESRRPVIRPESGVGIAREYNSLPTVSCQTFFHFRVGVVMKLARIWQPKKSVTLVEVKFCNALPATTPENKGIKNIKVGYRIAGNAH